MERRIFGLENEYGVTCTLRGQRRLSPDEVARYLFRRVVSWGRSSNVFLQNGARLYLDVGSHPEYATPECDSLYELVVHDKAGERILESLVESAEQRLAEESIRGTIYLFKNNTDSAGNSYGCHENYCTSRHDDLGHYAEVLIPFLVSRQIYAGAGKVLHTARGATYSIAQRAEHIWEGVSSATTRSRPIINTRDEPLADAERFRRLHVIVGDSNMSEYTTFLKVGAAACMLRMLEDRNVVLRDMTLENPIRAIREISHDPTCRRTVRLGNGREVSALDIQREYLDRALRYSETKGFPPLEQRALEMWEHCVTTIENDPLKLDREVDWVIKFKLLEAFRERHGLPFGHPRVQLLDLQYHDVSRARSPFYKLQDRGMVERLCTDADIDTATDVPATDDPGPPARRVRPPGQGAQARLHGRLGAPQAQRPGATHRAVQGPVQEPRRARREADRVAVTDPTGRRPPPANAERRRATPLARPTPPRTSPTSPPGAAGCSSIGSSSSGRRTRRVPRAHVRARPTSSSTARRCRRHPCYRVGDRRSCIAASSWMPSGDSARRTSPDHRDDPASRNARAVWRPIGITAPASEARSCALGGVAVDRGCRRCRAHRSPSSLRRTPANTQRAWAGKKLRYVRRACPGGVATQLPAQHLLVDHELAVVLADRAGRRAEAGVGACTGSPSTATPRRTSRRRRAATRAARRPPTRPRSAAGRRPTGRTRRPRTS